jgi:hypothetical protein
MNPTPPTHAPSLPILQRQCGPCTKCCTVMVVPELSKPAHVACVHVCEAGCGIHATRPQSCRNFICEWLAGDGRDDDRPDKLGIFFHYSPFEQLNRMVLVCQEVWPHAFDNERAKEVINLRASKELVLVRSERAKVIWLLGPPQELARIKPIIESKGLAADPALCPPKSAVVSLDKLLG